MMIGEAATRTTVIHRLAKRNGLTLVCGEPPTPAGRQTLNDTKGTR